MGIIPTNGAGGSEIMGVFWQGFVVGVSIILLPSSIYLAVLIQKTRARPEALDMADIAGSEWAGPHEH